LATVIWNNDVIFSVVPTDYGIHTAIITVTAVVGENILQFEGAGVSDTVGLGITNVALVRQGDSTNTNIVVNGDFSQPQVGLISDYQVIPGWTTEFKIEIGWGPVYNNWSENAQVCELDSEGNDEITQILTFDSNFQVISSPPAPTCSTTSSANFLL